MRSEPPLIAYFITFYQSQVKRRQFLWEMVCFFFFLLCVAFLYPITLSTLTFQCLLNLLTTPHQQYHPLTQYMIIYPRHKY